MSTYSEGFLLLNKPVGISSFDCIRVLKRYLPKKAKIGHTGTLDDGACGMLIICIGRSATKMVPLLMGKDKEYVVKAKLGQLTDSLDTQGAMLEDAPVPAVTWEALDSAMQSLCPEYVQIPPVYSALKFHGKPLYALAREQKMLPEELEKIVKEKARTVSIYAIELLEYAHPFFTFKATVSKGTYVRSVANDIACKLGTVATVHTLERTKVGGVSLSRAIQLNAINSVHDIEQNLISCDDFLSLFDSQ